MDFQEFRIIAHGKEIFGRHIAPTNPKGVILLVHGFGEHSGRYTQNVVPMLLQTDLAVVAYDNIGHGQSAGKRGHCPSYGALMDILRSAIDRAIVQYPDMPLFLYGHSMGGNLVLNYALRSQNDITGIVATSPYLRLAFRPPAWKMMVGKLFLRLLPSITMPSGLDPRGISRIEEEVARYKADPLVHDQVSPMFSFPVMDAGEWAIDNASDLKIDTLLLHGTADPIIDYQGSEEFHKNATMTTLRLFEGAYHELHHDRCKKEMLETVRKWLTDTIDRNTP